MDPKSYIQSGILEQYVLGNLSESEIKEVEEYARQYEEIKQEIEAIEIALQEYAVLHGKTPPPGVLSNVLQQLDNTAPKAQKQASKNRMLPGALILLLGISALSFYFYRLSQTHKAAFDELNTNQAMLQANCDSIQAENNRLEQEIDLLLDPDTRTFRMNGTDLSPQAIAEVYYNTNSNFTRLNIINLPPPPANKQYQLWAFVDGKPENAGVFEMDINFIAELPFVANAENFAISLEDLGGSAAPSNVHLMGS